MHNTRNFNDVKPRLRVRSAIHSDGPLFSPLFPPFPLFSPLFSPLFPSFPLFSPLFPSFPLFSRPFPLISPLFPLFSALFPPFPVLFTFFPGPQKNRLISITTCTCESQQDSRTPKITSGIRTCKGQSHLSRNAQKGKVTTASWKRKANIQRWESNPPPPTPQREHASTEPHRQIQTVEK